MPPRRGRPWRLCLAAYWRTNLTLRQLAPLFGVSKSAADRIIDDLGPKVALRLRKRFAPGTVLIVDGTLVPTRDRSIAAPSKNYRYSTNHQVVIDADTPLVVTVGAPLPGNRNDCIAFADSGAEHACRNHNVIGDGGYIATSAIIPHRRRPTGLESRAQCLAPGGQGTGRARFRADEDLEDLARLPPARRRRRDRDERYRQSPQSRPHRLTRTATATTSRPRRSPPKPRKWGFCVGWIQVFLIGVLSGSKGRHEEALPPPGLPSRSRSPASRSSARKFLGWSRSRIRGRPDNLG
ncbi:transposase family protein [Glycomyces sp. TRM65418]|uniref:transposase n=1 Tax=Glycomyces sp. TRM65418 TaxID=2867006 RepID=UPI001D162082|nr:transposase [Glycomyces sp. TRM65418]MCC3761738.1 transposase family protein [Glycomyces sp. TRM65418]